MDWLYIFVSIILFGLIIGIVPYYKMYDTNIVIITVIFFFAWILACYVFSKRNQKRGTKYGIHSIGGTKSVFL